MPGDDHRLDGLRELLLDLRADQKQHGRDLEDGLREAAVTRQQAAAAAIELQRARDERAGLAERLTRVEGAVAGCDCSDLDKRLTTLEAHSVGASRVSSGWRDWLGVVIAAVSALVAMVALLK